MAQTPQYPNGLKLLHSSEIRFISPLQNKNKLKIYLK